MRLTIERAGKLDNVDGVPCGLWNGRTDGGTPCLVFVWAFAVPGDPQKSLEVGQTIGGGRLVIESGDPVDVPGVGGCRAWWGETAGGNPLCAYVRRIALPDGEDATEFDRDLAARPKPADWSEALAIIHPEAGRYA